MRVLDPQRLRAARTRRSGREPVVHFVHIRGVEVLRVKNASLFRHHVCQARGRSCSSGCRWSAEGVLGVAVAAERQQHDAREVIGAFVVSTLTMYFYAHATCRLDIPENASPLWPLESSRSYPKSYTQCSIASGKAKTEVTRRHSRRAVSGFQGRAILRMLRDVTRGFLFATGAYSRNPHRAVDLAHDRAYRARGLEVPDVAPRQHPEDEGVTCAFDRRAEREPAREGGFVFFARQVCFFATRSVGSRLEPTPTRYAYAAPARRRRRVAKCT